MRVVRMGINDDGSVERITPACAENTKALVNLMKKEEDHPRVCGEYDC